MSKIQSTTKNEKMARRSRRIQMLAGSATAVSTAAHVTNLVNRINVASRPSEAAIDGLNVTAGSSAELSGRVGASKFHRQALSHNDCYLQGPSQVQSCLTTQMTIGQLPVRLDLPDAVGPIHYGQMRPQTAYSSYGQ